MAPQSTYTNYYLAQIGGGSHNVYSGLAFQKGYGFGSFLGGIFRRLLPVFRSSLGSLGREAARTGAHVLADIGSGHNARESLKRHLAEAGDNLTARLKRKADDMQGSGMPKKRKVAVKKKGGKKGKRITRDIFSL